MLPLAVVGHLIKSWELYCVHVYNDLAVLYLSFISKKKKKKRNGGQIVFRDTVAGFVFHNHPPTVKTILFNGISD